MYTARRQVGFVLRMCSASLCGERGVTLVAGWVTREDVVRGRSRETCPCTASVWLFRMALLREQWDEGTYWLIHSGSGRREWGQQQAPNFWAPRGRAAAFSVLRLHNMMLFGRARAHHPGRLPARQQIWVQAGRRQRVPHGRAWGGCQHPTLPQKQPGEVWGGCTA